MKKVLFVINPHSGVDRKKAMQTLIDETLDAKQFTYEIAWTKYEKHGIDIARKAVLDGIDIIVAVGGDGSVNDLVSSIINTDTSLAIIPKGSGNGLARSLNIPLNTKKAIQVINTGNYVKIDAGKINNQYFVSNAGVGFDAVVTGKFAKSKSRGFKTYLKIIMQNLLSFKPPLFSIEIDGKKIEEHAFMLTIANGIQLGYGFKIAPLANIQDGLFDLVILKQFPKLFALPIAVLAFSGNIHRSRFVTIIRGKNIDIEQTNLINMQYDGESAACNQVVTITMLPQSVNVLVP